MKQTVNSLRGFPDHFGQSWEKNHFICEKAVEVIRRFGYEGISFPLVEYTEIFKRSLGDTSDVVHKEMYTFKDRNDESITLRPEGTAGVVRTLLSNKLFQELPQRFFYYGPMFRYERPQKGRFRQFCQFGVECFGVSEPYADVECLLAADKLFREMGLNDYILEINTLGDFESRKRFNNELVDYLKKYEKELSQDSQMRLKKNPMRILDSKDQRDQEILENAPKLKEFLSKESEIFFKKVLNLLSDLGIPYNYNDKIVRGLDYYCHTTFEFKHKSLGAQDAIGAGGRYDGLVEKMGGVSVPAVGWAIGVERIALLVEQSYFANQVPVVVIPFDDECLLYAMQILQLLRNHKMTCEISYRHKVSKDLKYAVRKKAKIALLVGSNEIKENKISIKYLDKDQHNDLIMKDDLIKVIQNVI